MVTHKLCKPDDVQLLDSKGVALERLASTITALPPSQALSRGGDGERGSCFGKLSKIQTQLQKQKGTMESLIFVKQRETAGATG